MGSNRQEAQKTALLLLEILHHIPKRSYISASEVHQRLCSAGHTLTLRSVQRHLKDLSEHFDIECNNTSRPYGYRWLNNAESFSLSSLTPQESLLLRLAEQQLSNLLPAKVINNLSGFFEQARKNLNPYNQEYPELDKQWLNKVRIVSVTQQLLPPAIDDEVLDSISNALYYNNWLQLDYQKIDGKKSNPTIMPLGLAQQGERLYLVCRFKGYNDNRSLAVHRIKKAKVLSHTFEYPSNFSLKEYDNNGTFLISHGRRIVLRFNFKKPLALYLTETPLSKDQTIEEHEDYLTITATVIDSIMLTRWLNSFGEDVWDIRKEEIEAV